MSDQWNYGGSQEPAPPAQQPYYPPQAYGVPPQAQGNGMAVAGMVLGIISLVFFWGHIFCWIPGILAIIFSALGLKKSKVVGKGRGMAMAGLITSIIGIVLSIVFLIILILVIKDANDHHDRFEREWRLDSMNHTAPAIRVETADNAPSPVHYTFG